MTKKMLFPVLFQTKLMLMIIGILLGFIVGNRFNQNILGAFIGLVIAIIVSNFSKIKKFI